MRCLITANVGLIRLIGFQITEQRKNWPRFGRAATETAADSVTVQQVEEIPFERIRQQKATSQEKKATDIQQVLATQTDKTIISGRCALFFMHAFVKQQRCCGCVPS